MSKVWFVTGAGRGIGAEIARSALGAGHCVVATGRKVRDLEASFAGHEESVLCLPLDVACEPQSVEAVAQAVDHFGRIDVLVNNVGVLLDDVTVTPEGFETSYATNLLTHWVLTEALLGADAIARDGTVIEMSSGGMYNVGLLLDYLGTKNPKKYSGVIAYAVAKRGQAELVKWWQARHGAKGMRFYCMHPGWADTDGVKKGMPRFRRILKSVLRDSAAGADTALWLAHARPAEPGPEAFWFDRAPREAHAFPHTVQSKYGPDDLAAFLAKEVAKVPEGAQPQPAA